MISPVFLAHGSPFLIFDKSPFTEFLVEFAAQTRPKAIVIFSAHFESDTLTISSTDSVYEMYYDYYGFPTEYYQVQYPARGSSIIASMLEERFKKHGIAVKKDTVRGLDHGVFPLLMHMYPEADIPVVQVSVNPALPPIEQFAIGEALRGLEREEILVIGSGFVVHNLRNFSRDKFAPKEQWSVEFVDWITDKVLSRDMDALFNYHQLAPHARTAVPRAEHFVPLLIAMGSGNPHKKIEIIHDGYEHGTLSNISFQF